MGSLVVLKLLHIGAAVLLLGNVTVTGVWAAYLYRVRDAVPFVRVARVIMLTDWIFTLSGGAVLTFTGIQLALREGLRVRDTPWLIHGIAALAVSTLVWLVVLLPDQFRMERGADGPALRRLFLRWSLAGWASTAVLFYGLFAMVTRR